MYLTRTISCQTGRQGYRKPTGLSVAVAEAIFDLLQWLIGGELVHLNGCNTINVSADEYKTTFSRAHS